MSDEAVKQVIKGIKEGAQALTPVAKDLIQQVRMHGIADSITGILIFLAFIPLYFVIKKISKLDVMTDYAGDVSFPAMLIYVFTGVIVVIMMIAGFSFFYDGMQEFFSPLYYLISNK